MREAAKVSSGRSRLPPAATIWAASCGISATGLSMRATIARFHGTISAARREGQGEAPSWRRQGMHIIAISNDAVRLSFLMALLRDAGIGSVMLDQHVSVMEGSIGAI